MDKTKKKVMDWAKRLEVMFKLAVFRSSSKLPFTDIKYNLPCHFSLKCGGERKKLKPKKVEREMKDTVYMEK